MLPASLSELQSFAAVARWLSFRQAAQTLSVSPSALSHTLRGLEARWGVRLLNRTTRSVALTPAGEQLLQRLGPALKALEDALDEVNAFRDSPLGTLRINAPHFAAEWVLAPLLTQFFGFRPTARL